MCSDTYGALGNENINMNINAKKLNQNRSITGDKKKKNITEANVKSIYSDCRLW